MNETNGPNSSGSVTSSNPFSNIGTGAIVIVVIVAFVLSMILLATIVEKKKAPRNKFLRWLREYLNFRSILISGIIKFVYLFLAVFLTIMSVVVMCQGQGETTLTMIGIGFAMMIFGNIFLRILLEMTMAVIVVWENTSDIRAVLVKDEEAPEEKKPKEPKEASVMPQAERLQQGAVASQTEIQRPPIQQP